MEWRVTHGGSAGGGKTAAMERFFGLPEGSLREMKPGEKLVYKRQFPLSAMNLSQTKVGRPPVSELDVQDCEGSKSPL